MKKMPWGVWTRTKGSFEPWERMTQFGKELSFPTKEEAEKFVKQMRAYGSPYEYEVRPA